MGSWGGKTSAQDTGKVPSSSSPPSGEARGSSGLGDHTSAQDVGKAPNATKLPMTGNGESGFTGREDKSELGEDRGSSAEYDLYE